MDEFNQKLAYNVDELSRILGVSKPLAYALTKKTGFPAVKVSERRIIIPANALREWLDRASREA